MLDYPNDLSTGNLVFGQIGASLNDVEFCLGAGDGEGIAQCGPVAAGDSVSNAIDGVDPYLCSVLGLLVAVCDIAVWVRPARSASGLFRAVAVVPNVGDGGGFNSSGLAEKRDIASKRCRVRVQNGGDIDERLCCGLRFSC